MNTSLYLDKELDETNAGQFDIIDEYYDDVKNMDKIRRSKLKCLACGKCTSYAQIINCEENGLYHYQCVPCDRMYAVCFHCQDINSDSVSLSQLITHLNSSKTCDFGKEIHYAYPIYFYDENKYGPITGPNGGSESTWKCKCSVIVVNDL